MGNNYSWVCGEVVSWFFLSESIMMWNRARSSSNLNSKAIGKFTAFFRNLLNMTQLSRGRALMGTCCHSGVRLEGWACSYQYWPAAVSTPVGGAPGRGTPVFLVTESWEVSAFRSSREGERETKSYLLSLTEAGQADWIHDTEDWFPFLSLPGWTQWLKG